MKKAVLGTFHQDNLKYGTTAGIQCTSNAFVAICFSVVKRVSIWKSFDLDYILDLGDKLMKLLEARGALCIDQLPLSVDIEGFNIRAQKLMLYSDLFNSVDLFFRRKCLSSDEIDNGAISRVLGLASNLYGIQTLFLCLILTAEVANVSTSQTLNQFVWNFTRWKP